MSSISPAIRSIFSNRLDGTMNRRTSSSVTDVCPLAPDSACLNCFWHRGEASKYVRLIGLIPSGRSTTIWLSTVMSSSNEKMTALPILTPPSIVSSTSPLVSFLATSTPSNMARAICRQECAFNDRFCIDSVLTTGTESSVCSSKDSGCIPLTNGLGKKSPSSRNGPLRWTRKTGQLVKWESCS